MYGFIGWMLVGVEGLGFKWDKPARPGSRVGLILMLPVIMGLRVVARKG